MSGNMFKLKKKTQINFFIDTLLKQKLAFTKFVPKYSFPNADKMINDKRLF